jgi:lysophospholipase L1-like esterase
MRTALQNVALAACSLLICLLVAEAVVFRFVSPASDTPGIAYVDEVVRLKPGARGVWRVRDEIAAPFRVNAQGWNSGVGDYRIERMPGVPLVAVVGDSFVEALQVPPDRSIAERLAERLAADIGPAEVYRFGISGAPLSQYVRMIEREVLRYSPDWIVIVLVHNDFDESFLHRTGHYMASFVRVEVSEGRVVGDVAPVPFEAGWRELLLRSATVRWLRYRRQVTREGLRRALSRADEARYEAGIDVDAVAGRMTDIEAATDHLFGRLADLAGSAGAELLLVMDGNRELIYAGLDPADSTASELNRLAERLAAAHGIPFLDLHEAFAADWSMHGRRFEFRHDTHWNEHGHALAADAVADRMLDEGL